ncbi:MAG TPA: VanZ family protein, partial [Longimicrobiales bacterium]
MPAVVWAAVVLFVGGRSNVPTVESPLPLDKIAHFFMYGLLGGLATWGWLKAQRPRRLIIVLVLAMAVGVADEIHQRSVPNRTSDI